MILEKLDADRILQIKLPYVIDAFIDFYGTSKKMNITKKFTSSLNVGYLTIDRYVNLVDELLKEVTLDAEKYFFKEIGVKFTEEREVNYFGTRAKTFEYTNIDNFFKYINEKDDFAKEKVLVALKIITGDDTLEYGNKKTIKYIDKFKTYKDEYKRAKKYREKLLIDKGYKKYVDNGEQIEVLKQKLEKKHNLELLKKILPFLSEKDRKYYEKHKHDPFFDFSELEACGIIFSGTGPSINSKMIISYFTSESNKILNDKDAGETEKFLIKNNRIDYFKLFGFDYGNDYERYINTKKCNKLIPSETLANTIERLRKEEHSLYVEDLILNMPHLQNAMKRKKRRKRIYPDDGFTKTILSGISKVLVNGEKVGHTYDLAPLFMFNAGVRRINDDYLDARLIKGFNRLYELIILKQDDNKITYSQGFELKEYNIDKREAKKLIECKLLNEIIDEFIAEDITKAMHKKGNYIFGKKGMSKTNTKLEKILGPFTKAFYTSFKDEILAARENGKISLLLNVVGQENFTKFNSLLKEIYKNYDENEVIKIQYAKKKKLKLKEIKEYDRYMLNSNTLIKKMLAYKEKYRES